MGFVVTYDYRGLLDCGCILLMCIEFRVDVCILWHLEGWLELHAHLCVFLGYLGLCGYI